MCAGQAGQLSTGGGIRGESPFDAAANSGCGGGARGGGASGSGGSGIVFIKYADTFPAATSTTGSPTITTSGGYRLYKFTGSGTITF